MKTIIRSAFLAALFFAFAAPVLAQNEEEEYLASTELASLEVGLETVVFGDKINVRSAPKKDAPTVDQLLIGHAVKILAADTARVEVNGWSAVFHQIEYEKAGAKKTGWAWGGLLSPNVQRSGDVFFVYNVLGSRKIKRKDVDGTAYETSVFDVEFRAVRGEKVVSAQKMEVNMDFGYMTSGKITGPRGVKNCQNVLVYSLFYPACGYSNYDQYFLWDGQKLAAMPLLTSASDAGAFYETEEYIFPDDQDRNMTGELLYRYELGQGMEADGEIDGKTVVRKMVFDGKKWSKPKI